MGTQRTLGVRLSVDGGAEALATLKNFNTGVGDASATVKASLEALSAGDAPGKVARDFGAAAQRILEAQNAIKAASSPAEQIAAQEQLAAATKTYAAVQDTYLAKLVPVVAAERQRAKELAAVEAASKLANLTDHQRVEAIGRVEAAYKQRIEAATGANAAAAAAAAADQAAADRLDYLRTKLIAGYADSKRYETGLAEIAEAQQRGALTAAQATAATETLNAQLAATNTTMKAVRAAEAEAAAAAKTLEAAQESLRSEFVTGYAASKQYEGQLGRIDAAEAQGVLTAKQAQLARERATAAFSAANAPAIAHADALKVVETSSGGAAAATRNLSIQVIQGASGIASGQPILTTFIQQGHQVADSALAMGTGFGGIATAAKGMLAAVGGLPTVLGVAVVAGIVAIGAAAEHESKRLADLRQQLRATQDGYVALAAAVDESARRVAASTTLSTAEARTAAQTIASAKYFSGTTADIERLAKMSADLARVWNVDVGTAAAKLRDAINDPAAAAKKFAEEGLPAFNGELLRNVERLQAAGRGGDALKLVLSALSTSSAGATKDASPLTKALHDLEQSFYGAKDGGKSLATVLGDFVNLQVARVVTGLDLVIQRINDARRAGLPTTAEQMAQQYGGDGGTAGLPFPTLGGGSRAGTIGGADPIAALVPAIRGALASSADRYGVDKALLARLQLSEGRLTENGTWETSSAGAVGPMQVKPDTFAGLPGFAGRDINNIQANLDGGTSLFAHLLDKYGSPYLAVLAYHDGETLMDKVLRGERRATGASYVSSNDAIQQAEKVAGGYAGTGRIPRPSTSVGPAGADFVSPPTGQDSSNGLRDNARAADDALNGLVSGTREIERANIADKIKSINEQMQRLRDSGREGTAEYRGLVQQTQELTAASNQLLTPQGKFIRGEQDRLAANQGVFAGDQKILAIRQQMAQVERDQGGTFSAAERAKAESIALAEQSVELKRAIANIDLGIASQLNLVDAYKQGYAAVAQATASNQAYQESIKLFPVGSKQAKDAQAALTAEYVKAATAAQELKVAASTADNKQQLEYIAKETELLGASTEVRTRDLAVYRARQELEKSGVKISEEAKNAYLASIAAVADGQAKLGHLQQTLTDLENIGTQAFDRIGSAITTAFTSGGLKAIDFGGIVKGVLSEIAQQALKLAIVNPLLNSLFGGSRTTLSDVGGLFGNIFGNSTSLDTSTAETFVVGAAAGIGGGAVFNRDGNSVLPSDLTAADKEVSGQKGTIGADGGISFSSAASTGLGAVKALDFVSGGKLLEGVKSYVFDAVGFAPGQSIGSWVSSLVGESVSDASIAAATAADLGTSVAEGASAAAVSGAASAAGEAAIGAIGAAVNTISTALPFIGTAITVIADLAQGNYRGAALVAVGAAIGTAILPGIGTAVGAFIGGLVDTFLPNHPKHPYQDTEVDIQNGHLVAAKQVSQIESSADAAASVDAFGAQLDQFMAAAGLKLTNLDSAIGHVGEGITGLTQVTSVDKLFNKLQFANVDSDTSNFGVAKGALVDMRFNSTQELSDELLKIARFADGMDHLGFKLQSVGKDLTDITIASVSLTGALDAAGNAVNADGTTPSDAKVADPLRTALAHDLPGQRFANVDALSAEIDKVNTFVNGTIPGLLNPVLKTTSASRDLELQTIHTYEGAIEQAGKYGLATDMLAAAQVRAVDLIRAQGVGAIAAANTAVAVRLAATAGGAAAAATKSLADFDAGLQAQRDQLKKLYTDTYGDITLTSGEYLRDQVALERTMAAERAGLTRQLAVQQETAVRSLQANVTGVVARGLRQSPGGELEAQLAESDAKAAQERLSFREAYVSTFGEAYLATADYQMRMTELERVQEGERLAIVTKYSAAVTQAVQATFDTGAGYASRLAAAGGDSKNAELINYDTKAAQERAAFIKQFEDTYGAQVTASETFQAQLATVDRVHYLERLAIQKKYTDQAETQARTNVSSLLTNLASYARSLETGANNPAAPTARYATALREFQAVSGAARAGDYASAGKLSGYADTLLSASREVNGSGAAYARDYARVADAVGSIADVTDALTASAQKAIQKEQTDALTQSLQGVADQLRSELINIRRELQQQGRAA